MEQSFKIEPFKERKRQARSDKGKRHNYPRQRRTPLNSSKNVQETNLSLNANHGRVIIMKHKGSPSTRAYWRDQKRKQRARK
jgi:hypothetical protein